jgi:hypothetical protein
MGRMIACLNRLCKRQLTMLLTLIFPNLIMQGFVSPCHIYMDTMGSILHNQSLFAKNAVNVADAIAQWLIHATRVLFTLDLYLCKYNMCPM